MRKFLMVPMMISVSLTTISGLYAAHSSLDQKDRTNHVFTRDDFPTSFVDSIMQELEKVSKNHNKQEIINRCSSSEDYRKSMRNLEEAVAAVAIRNSSALSSLKQLNQRFLQFLNLAANLHLINDQKITTPELIYKEVDQILIKNYSTSDRSIVGAFGNDIEDIRAVFEEGNIRERARLALPAIMNKLMNDYILDCNIDITLLEKLVGEFADIKGDFKKVFYLKCHQDQDLFRLGRFSYPMNSFRKARPNDEKLRLRQMPRFNYTIMDPPLSKRESNFLGITHDAINSSYYISYQTGKTEWEPNLTVNTSESSPDPNDLYYTGAKEIGFDIAVSPSGTIDGWLNMACLVGLSSQEDLEGIRVAAIGYLITSQHHTIYEVIVGSKSFKNINIKANSDFYKYLYATHMDFSALVEKEYKSRFPNTKLPTEMYLSCINSVK